MEITLANNKLLQTAATTGNGVAVDLKGECREIVAYIEGSGGVTAGKVKIETADDVAYAGTWALVGTEVTVAAKSIVNLFKTGCFKAIRARVSVTIVGTLATASGGSTLTVIKAAAGWTTNLYAGCTVTMTGGTAGNIGLVRTISSNDATTLNFTPALPFSVANLDTFTISGDVSVRLDAN